jgi:choice-of-anchor B domain-containing protein
VFCGVAAGYFALFANVGADTPLHAVAVLSYEVVMSRLARFTVLSLFAVVPAVAAAQGFGGAVLVTSDHLLISEPMNTYRSGVLYVYERDAQGAWAEAARLHPSDQEPQNRFGRALALEGNTLLVGATSRAKSTGGVYVFERDESGAWREVALLQAADGAEGDALGRKVMISGDFVFASALGVDDRAGAVYAFRRDPEGRWSQHAKLAASDGVSGDFFGMALAADAERLLVGAPLSNGRTGAVYSFAYDAASETWSETGQLTPTRLSGNSQFGASLLVEGDEAMVAAPFANRFVGTVFVFRRGASGEWAEHTQIAAPESAPGTRFGSELALFGDELWVGAQGAGGFEGRVFRYRRDPVRGWIDAGALSAADAGRGDGFGGTIAGAGNVAVIGLTGDDYGAGSAIVFARAGVSGEWIEREKLLSEVEGLPAITGGQVECRDGSADRFTCRDVDLVSFLPTSAMGGGRGVQLNDIWGWTDSATAHEYALVGRVDGTAFVDVTDPANPVYLGDLPKTEGSPGSTWRDIKVYKDHACLVADGAASHGIQIFDLTQLRDVQGGPKTFAETAHYDRIHSAHNIVINEESGHAFTVGNSAGGETCGGGLHMINIQDPTYPAFAGCFADTTTGRASTGYSHDAMCIIYQGPDEDHRGKEVCFGANETALSIADVSDKANPVAIAKASYPNVGYSHQGWITEDHRYFYMNDELDEIAGTVAGTRTLVWDVTDLDDPILAREHISTNRASDHNLYVRGNLMFQSNYMSGLRVLDVSNPTEPVEVGFFDTVPIGEDEPQMGGSWSNYPYFASGVVVVTSRGEGLFVLRPRPRTVIP